MMSVVDLSSYNTLRLPAKAKKLIEINSEADIKKLPSEKIIFLGEGANILFKSAQLDQLAKINLKGKKVIKETDDSVYVEVAAGENWHDFVMFTADNSWSGVEDLAFIPGTIGAAPIQNIGAYGQSLDQTVESVEFVHLKTGKKQSLSKSECQFRYRDSIFKHELKNQIIITSVVFRLSKIPQSNLDYYSRYESLQAEIAKIATPPYSVRDVSRAVINIRTKKMPDWTKVGTAGSFFKNPFLTKIGLKELQKKVPDIQYYPTTGMDYPQLTDPKLKTSDYVKIPAGRLLDELGWKGKRVGNVGTFDHHALAVVTYPGATGQEVYEFTENMRADVKKNFDINLEYEVVII